MILEREKANLVLKDELLKYQQWCHDLDKGIFPEGLRAMLNKHEADKAKGGKAKPPEQGL